MGALLVVDVVGEALTHVRALEDACLRVVRVGVLGFAVLAAELVGVGDAPAPDAGLALRASLADAVGADLSVDGPGGEVGDDLCEELTVLLQCERAASLIARKDALAPLVALDILPGDGDVARLVEGAGVGSRADGEGEQKDAGCGDCGPVICEHCANPPG